MTPKTEAQMTNSQGLTAANSESSSMKPDVVYIPNFLPQAKADELLARIKADADFRQNYIQLYGRNPVADEIVLVAADEGVAQGLRIGLYADTECLGGFAGAIAEIGFREALHLQNLERNNRQEHVDVDVGNHGLGRHGGMRGEVLRSQQALFFRGHRGEQHR